MTNHKTQKVFLNNELYYKERIENIEEYNVVYDTPLETLMLNAYNKRS